MKSKRRVVSLALVVALIAILMAGGSLAYFTDTDDATNTFTVGKDVAIDLQEQQRDGEGGLEEFEQGKELMPINGSAQGEKDEYGMPVAENFVDKIVNVKNTGGSDAYIRVYFTIPAAVDNADASKNIVHVNLGNRVDYEGTGAYNSGKTEDWNKNVIISDVLGTVTKNGVVYNVYSATYQEVFAPEAETPCAICGLYLDQAVNCEKTDAGYVYTMGDVSVLGSDFMEEDGLKVYVAAVAVQAAGFDSADAAINAAFGANYIPFESTT